jgi:hypothetical protein
VTLRPPAQELWRTASPKLEAAFLAVAIMGIVLIQNMTMLGFWDDVERAIATVVRTDAKAVVYTVVFAAAIASTAGGLLLASIAAGRVNGAGAWTNFSRFGYAIIPLDVAGHVAHNLFHLLAEGGNVVTTIAALVGIGTHDASAALVGSGTIQVLQYGLLALGFGGSLYTAWRIAGRDGAQFLPYALLVNLFMVVNVALFALPMAHRM